MTRQFDAATAKMMMEAGTKMHRTVWSPSDGYCTIVHVAGEPLMAVPMSVYESQLVGDDWLIWDADMAALLVADERAAAAEEVRNARAVAVASYEAAKKTIIADREAEIARAEAHADTVIDAKHAAKAAGSDADKVPN